MSWVWDNLERFEKLSLGVQSNEGRQNWGIQRWGRMESLELRDMRLGATEKLQGGGHYKLNVCSGEGRSGLGFLVDREESKFHCSCHFTHQTFQWLPFAFRIKSQKSNLLCMACRALQGLAFATHPISDLTISLWKVHSLSTLNCPHFLESDIHTRFPL